MHAQPVAILRHWTGRGAHHDWLVGDPRAPGGRLWAVRTVTPPRCWPACRRWALEESFPHRRRYLTYQGPLDRGRGRVRRIEEGRALVALWSRDRVELVLALRGLAGRVRLRRVGPGTWLALWLGPASVEGRAG